MFTALKHTVTGCGCIEGSEIEYDTRPAQKQEVLLPLGLPKAIKKQLYMKQHSIAVAWWATVEILRGKIDDKTKQLREVNRLDWVRQEGVMAEALCSLRPDVVGHMAQTYFEKA
jgi:hypothetical protein